MMGDPIYDDAWRGWIDFLRQQIGFVDLGLTKLVMLVFG